MRKRLLYIGILFITAIVIVLVYPIMTQFFMPPSNGAIPQKAFSSQNPQEMYDTAVTLIGDGRVDEAIILFNRIIQENPGSDIAATCHFEIGGLYGFVKGEPDKMLQEYETVAREYRGTVNGFIAESKIIDFNYSKTSVPFNI